MLEGVMTTGSKKIFLTGVTGFIGKVVLEELLRRRQELDLDKVFLLIRPGKKNPSPLGRFQDEVASSGCFQFLQEDWTDRIVVVAGDLTQDHCGISESDRKTLAREATHIINCAASVEFDLPMQLAASSNILSSLNVLALAKQCPRLQSMVSVSTAYVTPFRQSEGKAIGEHLAPLRRPARDIYRDILEGRKTERELLSETGHPNTYTFTKCLAEHLLEENKGQVPLKIVRPSIVSAAWRYPFAGWIDSHAAFAGFVALIGSGYMRAVIAQYETLLDVVPVDEVATRIIDTGCFPSEKDADRPDIRHAVAGVRHSCNIRACISAIEDYFRRHPVAKYPDLSYVGGHTLKFYRMVWQYYHLPNIALQSWHGLRGQEKQRKQVGRLMSQVNYLNQGFPYFTHCTFDFHSSMPLEAPDFWKEKYIETVCMGVYHHLMKRDAREIPFAGAKHKGFKKDFHWALTQSRGNWAHRIFAYVARKGLRKCTSQITYDRTAFERAIESLPGDALPIVIPTHRSYMDFVLCSYLFFDQPNLRIAIPHIAAAQEFSRIPFLGWLFKQSQAFYIQRGLGKENPAITRQVQDLVKRRATLEFFIEGARSRSRQFLTPKRGMLSALQNTGQRCAILPISICYDRIPEEEALLEELKGGDKPTMRLRPLMRWLKRMRRGEVQLGRIHVGCGTPLVLDAKTDLREISRNIMTELQANMATTTHHLRAFVAKNPSLGLEVDWLRQAIEERGGQVLESPLQGEEKLSPALERTMRYHWMHWFYAEAKAAFGSQPAVANHLHLNGYFIPQSVSPMDSLKDRRVRRLLTALFDPIRQDYLTVADALGHAEQPLMVASAKGLARQYASSHLPDLEGAFADLVQQGILSNGEQGGYAWGSQARQIESYRAALMNLNFSEEINQALLPARDAHASEAHADHRSHWLSWTPFAPKIPR
jgi:1-acyl-sn-glycerol-3-phosphate acyltransferase